MANNTTRKTNTKSNTASKGNKKSTNTKSNTKKTETKRSARTSVKEPEEIKERDPFFEDTSKDLILLVILVVSILLFLSNFRLGGIVGNTVGSFLFGVFGIVQYVLPIVLVISIFFFVSNYGNGVAVAKIVSGIVFVLFISVLTELIIHANAPFSAKEAYDYSFEYHNGGGFIGGGLVKTLVNSIGVLGSYVVVLAVLIGCGAILFEKFLFRTIQRSVRNKADRDKIRRRLDREDYQRERDLHMAENDTRRRAKEKINEELERQRAQEQIVDGPRVNRKRTGVTLNTEMYAPETISVASGSDNISEIKINLNDVSDVEVTDTSRTKISSGTKESRSSHFFKADNNVVENASDITRESIKDEPAVLPTEKPHVLPVNNIKINLPEEPSTTSAANLIDEAMAVADNAPKTNRTKKPTVASAEEIEKTVEATTKEIEQKKVSNKPYKFPPYSLLKEVKSSSGDSKQYLEEMSAKLTRTLHNFGVEAQVTEVTRGPSVTRYEIAIAEGVKVSKVVNLADDIKLNMAVTDLRIEAPIPGKSAIGIEVPNKEKSMVSFAELVKSPKFKDHKSKISFCVGKDIGGEVIIGNIEKMPHLLIAGATGSGKSVCINTLVMSILYHADPKDVKLIMVDPKMVELSVYNGIPHLLMPVITDAKKAAGALHWAVKEMMDRYDLLSQAGVRNIEGYNDKIINGTMTRIINGEAVEVACEKMPQIVIILDELADLMMVAAADVEESICRIAQLARACGIHLVIATQRPTANVITGLIKANVPSRIAFSVASGLDSRVILDMTGAEDLLGHGDMLYFPTGMPKPVRLQGAFVDDDEIARVVEYIKMNNDATDASAYQEIESQIKAVETSSGATKVNNLEPDDGRDPLFGEAGRLVIENNKGSIGYLQRNFRIGFNRAARIMDQLAEAGVVGPEMGTKPREIKMSVSQFEELLQE